MLTLPWTFEDYGNGLTIADADEFDVAVVSPRNDKMMEYDGDEYKAANLIVRAVNNHDKLVEALREALPIIEDACEARDGRNECGPLAKIRNLLASLES